MADGPITPGTPSPATLKMSTKPSTAAAAAAAPTTPDAAADHLVKPIDPKDWLQVGPGIGPLIEADPVMLDKWAVGQDKQKLDQDSNTIWGRLGNSLETGRDEQKLMDDEHKLEGDQSSRVNQDRGHVDRDRSQLDKDQAELRTAEQARQFSKIAYADPSQDPLNKLRDKVAGDQQALKGDTSQLHRDEADLAQTHVDEDHLQIRMDRESGGSFVKGLADQAKLDGDQQALDKANHQVFSDEVGTIFPVPPIEPPVWENPGFAPRPIFQVASNQGETDKHA